MGPIGCPETLVWKYHSVLHKMPKEHISGFSELKEVGKIARIKEIIF
jgi:hypothetical protein